MSESGGDLHLRLLGLSLLLLLLLLPIEKHDLSGLLGVDGPQGQTYPSLSFLGALAGKVVYLLAIERSLTHCHILILIFIIIFWL